jgi:thioester reductase-like protein
MAYFLLTGATGLLGRYLLRDLALADVPTAVVVRPTRWESPTQRIETAMARWEKELGRALARPVVLEGDITEPSLGLNDADVQWLTENCDSIIHSAASLTFQAESADGEPWISNIGGTRNVLELCRRANITQCHHVSTAYVCGLRRGRILETDLDVGQELGNDYERSKLTSEKEVHASGFYKQLTVYRPAIIVGDYHTGFTTSYHGFYTPLRLVHSLLQTVPLETFARADFLSQLQLEGNERKNFVPVDWVSAAMTWLITHPECHGKTYHLTTPTPATAQAMAEAIGSALIELVEKKQTQLATRAPSEDMIASFREQMKIYQAYWRDDPEFDSTQTEQAIPHLPCPEIDRAAMDRLIGFAIRSNFGWPREMPIVAPFNVAERLNKWLAAGRELSGLNGHSRYVSLMVSGRGGGQWHLVIDRGRLVGAKNGIKQDSGTVCYLTSDTFSRIVRGNESLENFIHAGQFVVTGNSVRACELEQCFRDLVSDAVPSPLPT